MIVELIVAKGKNNVIGKNNELLWHIPEDMKHFKRTTTDGVVIMGRKTWESIGQPLQYRRNVVITRQHDYSAPGAEVVHSLDEALDLVRFEQRRVFIIGGAEIYRQAISKVDIMWITEVDDEPDGDAYFDVLDEDEWDKIIILTLKSTRSHPSVVFYEYIRKSSKE